MNDLLSMHLLLGTIPFALLATSVAPAHADDSAALPAPGLVEFAGRAAHHHWNLFGPGRRDDLDRLNRELRQAQQQMRRAPDDAARQVAADRGATAAAALLEIVRQAPGLIRVDLTQPKPHLRSTGSVTLPGDTGALLFEVQAGGEGLSFSQGQTDLATPTGESSLVSLEAAPAGLTYVLASLEHLPVGRTTLTLEFRRRDLGPARLPIEVATPQTGRLRVTVLSDDTGQPTPAMVRLMWRTDGLQRRPSNGLEFAPQFDRQGNATGARAANLPAPLDAHFWCVPGPFDMALAPGNWQIGVRRGVEHEVLFEDVTILSGQTVERTLRPKRWTDMRQRGWWSGDDHVHGRILDDTDAARLMAWVKAEDIHLANVVKMGDIYRTYFEQRGFGRAYRVIDGDTALVPGQECPRTHDQIGHTLAMNITAMVRDPEHYFLYDTVFDAVHAQGGLTGYAHVNSGLFHVHRDMSLNLPRGKVDFAEILQFNQLGTDLYYEFLNLGCKLTASAGSDVPWGGTIGEVRAYAHLGHDPFTPDRWFDAFRRGRTFATSGPMIEFRVNGAFPGDEINPPPGQPLRVQARAWGDPRRMRSVKLEIVRHGEVLRRVESPEGAAPEASLDFTVDAGHGGWVAARAWAGDGTSAHTTPVYVVRDGLRFWKFEALDELLAQREESLRQIEGIVAEAQRLEAEGRLDNDRYRQQLARQGPALLERVTLVRQVYADLRRVAESERPRRTTAAP